MSDALTVYTSQQGAFLATMKSYLQNPSNWLGGTPLITDFTAGSIAYTLLSAVSAAMDSVGMALFMTRMAAYIGSAVGSDLDNKVADFGLTRNAAVAASGTFTFTKNNPASTNIDVPAGTQVATIPDSSGNQIVYATTVDATLSSGNSSVQVTATALAAGAASNLAAGTQLLLASGAVGIDGVTLTASITNGADAETDTALRTRALLAFQALAHGTVASYQEIVMGVAGIEAAIVVPQNRGPGTVDIFIEGPGNSIPSSTLQAAAQAAIDAQKVATDDVQVLLPTTITVSPTLSVHVAPDYDPTSLSSLVQTAVQSYIESLGVGAQGAGGYIYASQLVTVANGVAGVLNSTTTWIDTAIFAQQVPVAGVVTVNFI